MVKFIDALNNIFFGTDQSKYSATAIFLTIALLCFFIIFSNSDISIEQRLMVVFFIILSSIPSVFFALFELTCISAGSGNKSVKSDFCGYLAWIITIIIVIYCILIMIAIIMSMSNFNTAIGRITDNKNTNKVSDEQANKIAKDMMVSGQSPKVSESMSLDLMPSMPSMSSIPVQSKDEQVKKPSVEMVPQQPHYNASNTPFAEAAGYDSADIFVSIKDDNAFVPSVPKPAPMPKVEMMGSSEPEAFGDSNLMAY
jgi:hypothetical protein